ncbi:VOC family protein [Nonomuraea purpurea]|uniref:VOC family protein n=1 Tax=Nonomuraea purpurea TaxID=1849276 RepID=A0ABV8GGT5_9ACTN
MATDHTLHHIGITVADLDAAEAFWEALLRTESVRRYTIEGPFIAEMTGYDGVRILGSQVNLPSGGYLELLQYLDRPEGPISPETAHPGNVHICLVVEDAQAEWDRAVALGATPRSARPVTVPSGANAGALTGYLRTADGVTIELFQPPR